VKQKWVYPLLLTFLVFFVLSNPQTAGPQARSFFSWLGDQASAAGTFFEGLFNESPGNSTTPRSSTATTVTGTGARPDSFNTLGPLQIDITLRI
jgi:hypothetical protein